MIQLWVSSEKKNWPILDFLTSYFTILFSLLSLTVLQTVKTVTKQYFKNNRNHNYIIHAARIFTLFRRSYKLSEHGPISHVTIQCHSCSSHPSVMPPSAMLGSFSQTAVFTKVLHRSGFKSPTLSSPELFVNGSVLHHSPPAS